MSRILEEQATFAAVVMERESLMPSVPAGTDLHDCVNFKRHFQTRFIIEEQNFGNLRYEQVFNGIQFHVTNPATLNSVSTIEFIRMFAPDACIIFGTDIVKDPLIQELPYLTLNIHLGLSPWYRGSATLFWPFYFMAPQCAGLTVHKIINSVDAGDILQQSIPVISKGMGIHDVGAAVVKQGSNDVVRTIRKMIAGDPLRYSRQTTKGRLFLTRDFEPHHLRINYDLYDDRMVDALLDGHLGSRQPTLTANL